MIRRLSLRDRKDRPARFKIAAGRAECRQEKRREAAVMVKGTNRRVIVVRSPDPQVFEEAIFVLREDWMRRRSADQAVEEARRAAGEYLRRCAAPRPRPARRRWVPLAAGAGAAALGALWLVLRLTGAG